MLDSGATLGHGSSGSREKARATLRGYNARARREQAAMKRNEVLVASRLAIGLVSFKPRMIEPPKRAPKPKRAYVRKMPTVA